jgi:uncharacterized protein YbjT (DUF2867 family)
MKILVFGASGMIGQGVLRECLRAPDVSEVIVVGRTPLGVTDAKLREVVHADFTDFTPVEAQLACDACLFCLGVSSAGMSEADYTRVTYDYTLAAARSIVKVSPQAVFIYVSGAGTDSTEKKGGMWARVKGKTENALLAMPFRAVYMFRPGGIQPMHGAKSKTRSYRIAYTVAWPLLPLLKAVGAITTTERMGLAMLNAVRHGAPAKLLGTKAINQLAREQSASPP